MQFEVVDIGASALDETTKVLTVQAGVSDNNDFQSYDDIEMYGQLGLTARPYPADDAGSCQGVVAKHRDGFVFAARDTRTSDVYGELGLGDSVFHAVGPNHRAKVFCKEETDSVVIMTKDTSGKDMVCNFDGSNDTITISAYKTVFQMTRDGISMGCSGAAGSAMMLMKSDDASIWLNAAGIHLDGSVYLGPSSTTTLANNCVYAPAPSPGGSASTPFLISTNVFISS